MRDNNEKMTYYLIFLFAILGIAMIIFRDL